MAATLHNNLEWTFLSKGGGGKAATFVLPQFPFPEIITIVSFLCSIFLLGGGGRLKAIE